jgi:hypothetical protein
MTASKPRTEPQTWTCPHGVVYSGSDDFVSGARNAHDEYANAFLSDRFAGERSLNDIAQDIIDLAPQAEEFVEEWFAALSAVKQRWAERWNEEA